jgi:hypothetical protein
MPSKNWLTAYEEDNGPKENAMSRVKRYAKKQAKASRRRRQKAYKRLARDRRQAQRAAEVLHHAVQELGLPAALVAEIAGRLRRQHKLLGKILGVMFPALFGCRTPSELCRVRGWDKHWPARLLGALPKRSWLKRLRRLGLEVLEPSWRHVHDKSLATQSRWQWTWGWDDSVFRKYGEQLRLVGKWGSGQHQRVVSGIDGLLLLVVVGDGRLVVPVDFAMRRPDPLGPGAPCRDKLTWARVRLDERLAAFGRRGLELPAPMGVADSWFGDSTLMQHVRDAHQGTLLVEGKVSYCFPLADGRQVKGHDLIEGKGWHWQQPPWEAGVRDVRLRATSPPSGQVTVVIVDEPGQDRVYLLCLETERSAPQLIRRWRRRSWIAFVLRTLKHLLATESCQVHSEDAYYGHLVLRLMGCFVLFYTSRVICKGKLTMEEIIFSVKHYWRFVERKSQQITKCS